MGEFLISIQKFMVLYTIQLLYILLVFDKFKLVAACARLNFRDPAYCQFKFPFITLSVVLIQMITCTVILKLLDNTQYIMNSLNLLCMKLDTSGSARQGIPRICELEAGNEASYQNAI